MNFCYKSGKAQCGEEVFPPSPNEGRILRALQEGTQQFHLTLGRAQKAHPNMMQGHWEGWMDMEDVNRTVIDRIWCRPASHQGMWSDSTLRAHLKRLVEKGWVQHKVMDRRVHWRVRPNRLRPFYEPR